jgi:hypothetical protein
MLVLDLASLHLSSHANEFCLGDQAVCFGVCNDVQQADLLIMLFKPANLPSKHTPIFAGNLFNFVWRICSA